MGCTNSCNAPNDLSILNFCIRTNDLPELIKEYGNNKYSTHENEQLFTTAWNRENFEIMKWLWNKHPMNSQYGNILLISACRGGRLDMAKWIYELSLKNNLSYDFNKYDLFAASCQSGNIELVKWLLGLAKEINSPIDIHRHSEEAFRNCRNIDMAKLLWDHSVSIQSPINIHAENDNFWVNTFVWRDLEMSKWIWNLSCEIKSSINIEANVFQISCQNNRFDMAKFALEAAKKLDSTLYKKYKYIQTISDMKENDAKKLKPHFEHAKNTKDNECLICRSVDGNILNLQCEVNAKKYDHTYCTKCFYEWYKDKPSPKCCVCSKEIDFDKILFFYD